MYATTSIIAKLRCATSQRNDKFFHVVADDGDVSSRSMSSCLFGSEYRCHTDAQVRSNHTCACSKHYSTHALLNSIVHFGRSELKFESNFPCTKTQISCLNVCFSQNGKPITPHEFCTHTTANATPN